MRDGNHDENKRFYKRVVARIDSQFTVPDDLCFILVQHAFTPSLDFFSSINHRIAAVIPKGSSARSNPDVVAQLKRLLPGRVYDNITRDALRDTVAARHLLKHATQGRTFAILEYGAYFAPSAVTIGRDDTLADKFVGIVEGTENGIKGSDDGETPGYRAAIEQLNRPVVSKSRSAIKHIMDLQIGPAIVSNTERLLMASIGCRLTQWSFSIPEVVFCPANPNCCARSRTMHYWFSAHLATLKQASLN